MELTRRDALAALAAVGAGATAGCGADAPTANDGRVSTEQVADATDESNPSGPDETALLGTLTAAAETLYPSEVSGHRTFVETYVLGRLDGRREYREGLVDTVAELDATARDWYGAPFRDLVRATRDDLLRSLGADAADPVPEGNLSARLRYYVVNELLYAFYSSPTGGKLVGIENPVGHPGGHQSNQRASMPGGGTDERDDDERAAGGDRGSDG